jgi:anti-sigma factor RsiW
MEMTMTGPGERAEGAALWQRWRLETPVAASSVVPDPLMLAAYADGRLDESQAETVEDWLADNPDALADLLAAQQAAQARPPSLASEALIARAVSLVPTPPVNLVRLRPAVTFTRRWRSAVMWSGLAASLVATSLIGFALGNDAYLNFADQPAAAESAGHELLDPPLNPFGDESDPAT